MSLFELIDKLFEIAKEKNIKQAQIARYIGISPAALTNWKHKRKEPSLYHLAVMADYIGVEFEIKDA